MLFGTLLITQMAVTAFAAPHPSSNVVYRPDLRDKLMKKEHTDSLEAVKVLHEYMPVNVADTHMDILLPRESNGIITLVLDMDDTLLHCEFQSDESGTTLLQFLGTDGRVHSYYCKLRPGLIQFLEAAEQNFRIVIFTAGTEDYAETAINWIQSEWNRQLKYSNVRLLKYRFYRQSCHNLCGNYVKDLRIFGDTKKIVIVDNRLTSFAFQPGNGIPIPSWPDVVIEPALDTCLKDVLDVLDLIRKSLDPVTTLGDIFGLTSSILGTPPSKPSELLPSKLMGKSEICTVQ